MKSRREFVFTGLTTVLASGGAFASPPALAQLASAVASDWSVASPDSQGISNAALERVLHSGEPLGALRSLLVIRNGFLIAERYYGPAAMSDLLPVESVTKSVCSMLVGLALQQGKIKSLSETVGSLLPKMVARAPASAVNAVTLAQILTGTTGLGYGGKMAFSPPDPALFVKSIPADAQTPPAWSYNDAAIALISPILVRALGMPVEEFAKRELFSPLGIKHFTWDRDAAGNSTSFEGLKLRPRDLAKIAWTMADGGRWRGKQVVPEGWVNDSTRFHVPVSWRIRPISDNGYGYLWFTGTLKGTPVAWALGYGSQFAVIVPSLHLAITTATSHLSTLDIRAQNVAVMGLVAQVVELAS